MAKLNQLKRPTPAIPVVPSSLVNMPITLADNESDGSETDFELDEAFETTLQKQETKSLWQAQFQHLLEFSEDILPTALYHPMKWCHISIRDTLKHIAKTEEILLNMGNDTRLLEMQLKVWKRRQQTPTSKSRLIYSIYVYKYAGDMFYFACYQNRGISPEIREQMESAFKAQFGSTRLFLTRSILEIYLRQFSEIEDFLSLLPEIYRSEVLAGLICEYLNPISRDDETGMIREKMNELLHSPDYHENQITLMLLAKEDCVFKPVILDCMIKFMIADPLLESCLDVANTRPRMGKENSTVPDENLSRYRQTLFLEAEPDLLVKACLATDNLQTPLFDIIATGLDNISVNITRNRSQIFEDFRPPLFDKGDPAMSLPDEYFRFFEKMKEASHCSLLAKVKSALSKTKKNKCVNTQFWKEFFLLLHSPSKSTRDGISFNDIYRDLCGA